MSDGKDYAPHAQSTASRKSIAGIPGTDGSFRCGRAPESFAHYSFPRSERAGNSADMSLRLSDALGTHAAFWSGLQMDYDLWHASRKRRPKVQPFHKAA